MSAPPPDPYRMARRRREHERQVVLFGILGLALAVVAGASLLFFTGAVAAPFDRPFTAGDPGIPHRYPPCLPEVPGQPGGALPVPYDQIHVHVRNAGGTSGLATAGREVLSARGFRVDSIGDWTGLVPTDELRFGRAGIVAAYTLAAQFENMRLVLDDRADASVHLIIGENFARPVPVNQVPIAAHTPLQDFPDCRPAAAITPEAAPTDYEPPPPPEPEPVEPAPEE